MRRQIKGIHDIATPLSRARPPENRESPKVKRLTLSPGTVQKPRNSHFKNVGEVTSVPRVWSFATKPESTRGRKSIRRNLFVERIEEPKTDVLKKMDNAVIMVRLPEVAKEDIHWELNNDIFSICAQNKLRSKKYVRELLLPFAADEESIRMRCREGIFEITLRRKQKEKAK
jgi:HSP20 family molecular chaperone IbpA